ncbi:MAG: hypothetical protein GXO62_04315 [Epsilonproteobacteria bacterium]|nr:hypothetical protein [Campylobacterota bacterium]
MRYLIIFLASILFAANPIIENLIGQKAKTYKGLIQNIDQNASLEEIITVLKENGLIDLFFDSPKIIHPKFIFLNNTPIFNTKTLYSTLQNLGYYYFYPSRVSNHGTYEVTIEMKSIHHIDPLSFIKEIKTFGCKVTDIKNQTDFIYTINCENEKVHAFTLKSKIASLINAKGEYWINPAGFDKIFIQTSRYDSWYPYVVFYDKSLNILNIYTSKNIERVVAIKIPQNTKYIKIRDNFTKENFKRGILIKGLK